MQIHQVSALTGALWLRDGWRLFKRQPLGLPAMVVVYLMGVWLPMALPVVGIGIAAILSPFLSLGMMAIVRDVDQGRMPSIARFAEPLRDERARVTLVRLGMVNAAAALLIALIVALVAVDATPAAKPDGPISVQDLPVASIMLQLLLFLPVTLVLWFAPVLAGWHGLDTVKSMFGSAVACWRNLGAFVVYGLVAGVAVTAVLTLVSLVMTVFGLSASRAAASLVIGPMALIVTAILQASFYPMYRSAFGDNSE